MLSLLSRSAGRTRVVQIFIAFTPRSLCSSTALWQAPSTARSPACEPLTAADLHQAAKLARLSGLCYVPSANLAAKLDAEGLQLRAQGKTSFTRWYTAYGRLDRPAGSLTVQQAVKGSDASDDSLAAPTSAASVTPGTNLVVLLRGISWRSEETEMMKLGQNLLKFWPVSLDVRGASSQGTLQAHGGMAEMAQELYKTMLPQIQQARQAGASICFAGHSLGGALAALLCSLTMLQQPTQNVTCTSFGSPPVLAHKDGKDGTAILELLGLPESSIRSFVLDTDPIPRAMLSVDPTFAFIKQWPGMASILSIRDWFTGQASSNQANAAKFMYNNVGEVYLITWSVDTGHKVKLLAPDEVEEQLKLGLNQLLTRPQAAMQALLDHTHHSYAQDLDRAARQLQA